MKTTHIQALAVAAMATLAFNAWADHHQGTGKGREPMDHGTHHAAPSDTVEPTLTRGEVRAINKQKQRITLKHDEIKNLNMAAMTMAFAVKEPAMLDQVKVGDTVEFKAVKDKGTSTLIELRVTK